MTVSLQILLHLLRDQAPTHHLQARRTRTTFVSLNQQKRVEGLFLSSGIVPDANTTMEKMLATVERLRLKEDYTGYIHLKLIPGASFEYIERAVELADRVSLNLEAYPRRRRAHRRRRNSRPRIAEYG